VAARRASGMLGLFVVPAAEVTFARVDSLDGTRSLGHLELDGVCVPDARMLGDPDVTVDATPAVAATIAEATVGMALDTVGVCGALFQSALEAALELAGRTLGGEAEGANAAAAAGANRSTGAKAVERNGGRNGDQPAVAAPAPVRTPPQAVRHSLAEMAGALERTRAIVYQATAAVAERHERATVTASQAKAAAGACQRLIVSRSIEIHGRGPRRADAQLWVRRAQSGELLLGSSADHHRVVADELFRAPKRQPASA